MIYADKYINISGLDAFLFVSILKGAKDLLILKSYITKVEHKVCHVNHLGRRDQIVGCANYFSVVNRSLKSRIRNALIVAG